MDPDKYWTMIFCTGFICFTLLIMQNCHYTHEEAMKCSDKGGTYVNDRCHFEKEAK
jgi:hypothetical protein